MIGFDPLLSTPLLWAWLIALAVVLGLAFWRLRGMVGAVRHGLILGLRITAAALIFLLLLHPFIERKRPDPGRFRVALLTDCSASMKTRDCAPNGTSRIEAGGGANARSLIQRLSGHYRFRPFVFAEHLRPSPGSTPAILPGNTAIGDSLTQTPDQFPNLPLGAVLLLSDGHNNQGQAPTEAAKQLRKRGIPVTVVGVGEPGAGGDLSVRFIAPPAEAPSKRPLELKVAVRNSLSRSVQTRLTLATGGAELYSRVIALEAGATGHIESFRITPDLAGFRTYAVRATPVPGDTRPETDVDYAGVRITDPVLFHILYLGGRLGWEYKFLKLAIAANRQLALSAVIRMGPASYYHAGFDSENEPETVPQTPEELNRFDAIVADSTLLVRLNDTARDAVRNFVRQRGGGLLCVGAATGLPEPFPGILPVLDGSVKSASRRVPLVSTPDFIFRNDPGGVLTAAPGPFLPANTPAWIVTQWKKGARPALMTPDGNNALLVAQAYGSGRVACLGLRDTWRWRLDSRIGLDLHRTFWDNLLVWLSSTAKPRFSMPFDGAKVPAGRQMELAVRLLKRDFSPAADARVSVRTTLPDGHRDEFMLRLSDLDTGRYSEWFRPDMAGEYTVELEVRRPDEILRRTAHFVARWTGAETTDTAYREDVLRDVARISGGVFRRYDDTRSLERLPLRRDVPVIRRRVYLSETAPWLLALLLLASGEWFTRRRSGLR